MCWSITWWAIRIHESSLTTDYIPFAVQYNAERGDISYLYRVGRIFYHGSIYSVPGGMSSPSPSPPSSPLSPIQIRVNFPLAHQYFLRIARNLYPVDNPISPLSSSKKDSVDENWLGYVAASCSYLGRMYLRGEGVERDHAKAKMWFERGAEMGERESHNGLGIMYRDGLLDGGKKDIKKAMVHFGVAAGQELPEAQVNIGKIHYSSVAPLILFATPFNAKMTSNRPRRS